MGKIVEALASAWRAVGAALAPARKPALVPIPVRPVVRRPRQ